jgi:hypothetical protein
MATSFPNFAQQQRAQGVDAFAPIPGLTAGAPPPGAPLFSRPDVLPPEQIPTGTTPGQQSAFQMDPGSATFLTGATAFPGQTPPAPTSGFRRGLNIAGNLALGRGVMSQLPGTSAYQSAVQPENYHPGAFRRFANILGTGVLGTGTMSEIPGTREYKLAAAAHGLGSQTTPQTRKSMATGKGALPRRVMSTITGGASF